MKRLWKIKTLLLAGITITLLSSCVYGPGYHHNVSVYYPYGYYYYPSVRVYFQYSTGFYFYLSKNNVWIRTKVLPPYIRLSASERVHIDVRGTKPYIYHKQHTEQYRPRPDYKPNIQIDRQERNVLQKWYQEQQKLKKDKKKKNR